MSIQKRTNAKEPAIRIIKLNAPSPQAVENYHRILFQSYKENLAKAEKIRPQMPRACGFTVYTITCFYGHTRNGMAIRLMKPGMILWKNLKRG